MTDSLEPVVSMEETESSDYLSSCDSVYSLDSASSIEEDCDDFDVFLSDGCEEEAKKAVNRKDRRRGLEAQRLPSRNPEQQCRALRPGLQTPAPLSRHPFLLANRRLLSNHTWTFDKNANCRQNRENAVKQPVHPATEGGHQEHSTAPRSPGTKRPRERAQEGSWTTVGLSRSQEPARTDGDRIFAQKCKALEGFIKPLMGLLNGLKRGRFEKGLSTFQQSVAMDRIQRIIGVLQKPEMGERYLGTLLQVEMMLKVWFPSVEMKDSPNNPECVKEEPEHKYGKLENHHHSALKSTARPHTRRVPHFNKSLRRQSSCKGRIPSPRNETGCEPSTASKESPQVCADWPVMNLTWMHSSPVPTPPHGLADSGHLNTPFEQNGHGPNLNSCGFILLLHNRTLTVPSYPRSASSSPNKNLFAFNPRKGYSVQTRNPPRSLSAPSTSSTDSEQSLELSGKQPETLCPKTWNLAAV